MRQKVRQKIRGVRFEANINAVSAVIIDNGDFNGGDEWDLCDHPFKALETLVSVHLALILYQKTCTRIETLLNSH